MRQERLTGNFLREAFYQILKLIQEALILCDTTLSGDSNASCDQFLRET